MHACCCDEMGKGCMYVCMYVCVYVNDAVLLCKSGNEKIKDENE